MAKKDKHDTSTPKEVDVTTLRRRKHVAGNRADAQRAKLDAQAEARVQQKAQEATAATRKPNGKHEQRRLLANRRADTTIAHIFRHSFAIRYLVLGTTLLACRSCWGMRT
jgi:hypothetical protein